MKKKYALRCKSNPQWDTTSDPLGWLWQRQTIRWRNWNRLHCWWNWKNADTLYARENNKEGNYLQPFQFLFVRSVLHLSHALKPLEPGLIHPWPPWGCLQLPVIFGKSNRPFSVLTLSGLSSIRPGHCLLCVPRLLRLSSPGFLPAPPLPPASVMNSFSLCCWSSFEFCPRPSSLLTPHAFSWVISCQISKSPIQIFLLKIIIIIF